MNRFQKTMMLAAVTIAAFGGKAFAAGAVDDAAKWDPRMAVENAVVDTNGVKWIDGRFLPIEGRWNLDETKSYYCRLPDTLTTNVNGGVRGMRLNTSGMQFRFRTDSRQLRIRWSNSGSAMQHMPATGVSGIDVYRFDEKAGKWRYVRTGVPKAKESVTTVGWKPGDACIINLPLYNGVEKFSLGIDAKATVQALGSRKSGVDKPVVFYGTSITHGGCCSRPGLGFVNWIGRDLDVPVFGLGFSGSGVMEYELSDVISRIDASCYVLDCLWNMSLDENPSRPGRSVKGNYEKFIRNLRAKRPGVPIVMAEHCNVYGNAKDEKDKFIRALYEKLVAEGWKDLVYLPNDEMYTGDYEGTVDGCHPNDLGMQSMAKAFGSAVRLALNLK